MAVKFVESAKNLTTSKLQLITGSSWWWGETERWCAVCLVLNCVRLLTRILAYIFEDPDWRGFFWSTLPRQTADESAEVFVTPCVYNTLVVEFQLRIEHLRDC